MEVSSLLSSLSSLLFAVAIIVLAVNVLVLVVAVNVVVMMMMVFVFCGAIYTERMPISVSATQSFTYGLISDRTLMS